MAVVREDGPDAPFTAAQAKPAGMFGLFGKPKAVAAETAAAQAAEEAAAAMEEAREVAAELKALRRDLDNANNALAKADSGLVSATAALLSGADRKAYLATQVRFCPPRSNLPPAPQVSTAPASSRVIPLSR
jgi:hypothetical protein